DPAPGGAVEDHRGLPDPEPRRAGAARRGAGVVERDRRGDRGEGGPGAAVEELAGEVLPAEHRLAAAAREEALELDVIELAIREVDELPVGEVGLRRGDAALEEGEVLGVGDEPRRLRGPEALRGAERLRDGPERAAAVVEDQRGI